MKKIIFILVATFLLYGCSENVITPTTENGVTTVPIVLNDVERGKIKISKSDSGLIINFYNIPDSISNVRIGVFVDEIVGEPSNGMFLVDGFIPDKDSYLFNWDNFYIDYNPNKIYYIYVHFELSSGETGWAGNKNRPYNGGTLLWTELLYN